MDCLLEIRHLVWAACPDGADYKLDRIGKQGSLIVGNYAFGCVVDFLINGAAQSNDSVVCCLILKDAYRKSRLSCNGESVL